jgi:hypothetical protein
LGEDFLHVRAQVENPVRRRVDELEKHFLRRHLEWLGKKVANHGQRRATARQNCVRVHAEFAEVAHASALNRSNHGGSKGLSELPNMAVCEIAPNRAPSIEGTQNID